MKKYITKQLVAIILGVIITGSTATITLHTTQLLNEINLAMEYVIQTAHKYNYENYLSGHEAFITIEQEDLTTYDEIYEFYSDKSSGKVDIQMACKDLIIKDQLLLEFGDIVNIGCRGYDTWEVSWKY